MSGYDFAPMMDRVSEGVQRLRTSHVAANVFQALVLVLTVMTIAFAIVYVENVKKTSANVENAWMGDWVFYLSCISAGVLSLSFLVALGMAVSKKSRTGSWGFRGGAVGGRGGLGSLSAISSFSY